MEFKVAIPARYASQRLPGKPLLPIAGKPMIQYVFEHALQSGAQEVVIATDDERIQTVAQDFGASVCMTSSAHESGTDRIAEAAVTLGWSEHTIVVNLQGDEPMMPAANIRQVAENLHNHERACIATLSTPIGDVEVFNDPNVVKVVTDRKGFALYFSRAPIPVDREQRGTVMPTAMNTGQCGSVVYGHRHIGLYAYRLSYLKKYLNASRCQIETLERLEQLRALWLGDKIHVDQTRAAPGMGVDTHEDLQRVEAHLSGSQA